MIINKQQKRSVVVTLMLLVGSIALMSALLPNKGNDELPSYELGKPWMHPMLTAKISIGIPRTDSELKRTADSLKANMGRYYHVDYNTARSQVGALTRALNARADVKPMVRQRLIAAVSKAYTDGIVDDATYQTISSGKMSNLLILNDNNIATTTSTSAMRSVRDAYMSIYNTLSDPDSHEAMTRVALNGYLVPNLSYDSVETNRKYDEEFSMRTAPTGTLQPGQSIIYPGNIVDEHKFALLNAYGDALKNGKGTQVKETNYALPGNVVLVAAMMVVFYLFMRLVRPRTFDDTRRMTFLISLITAFVMLAFLVAKFRSNYLYVMPFALMPIVATTFTDTRIGFFTHLVTMFICSLAIPDRQAEFLFMQFLAGSIAIASMKGLLRRSQLVQCAFFIFAAYSAAFCALCMARNDMASVSDWHFFLYFAINSVVLSFAYTVVFLEEKLFGFTSSLTLVELSDSNSPALRMLSERCPGTFQHSFQVANLATEVAHRIGANMQQVRAGALYHDIGKTQNPAFFTENQMSVNPHIGLSPEQSAEIVIAHVSSGLKLAAQYDLPQVIKDAIAQHHGNGRARYFYTMACKAAPDGKVDPAPFTYPGPNPQSKETAILMMCDACEAAAKSLAEPNEKNITAIVDKVIDNQVADGLLSEAPISFRDIGIAKHTIVEMLRTLYHPRISYPDDVKPAVTEAPADETPLPNE